MPQEIQRENWPQAASVDIGMCDDPQCPVVHMLLRDEVDRVIAEATIDARMVRKMQDILYDKATARER